MKKPGNKVPSQAITSTIAGQPKGAPAKKAVKMPSPTPTTQPLAVKKPAPKAKTAKVPSVVDHGPYGTTKHSK